MKDALGILVADWTVRILVGFDMLQYTRLTKVMQARRDNGIHKGFATQKASKGKVAICRRCCFVVITINLFAAR